MKKKINISNIFHACRYLFFWVSNIKSPKIFFCLDFLKHIFLDLLLIFIGCLDFKLSNFIGVIEWNFILNSKVKKRFDKNKNIYYE